MKFLNIFVAILLLVGAASAVVELSGTDPAVFDQPGMAKEGLRTMIAAEVWGTPIGWNNKADGTPYGNLTPALVGSNAKNAYMLTTTPVVTETYLDNAINFSDNITILDDLNVTEGEPESNN